MEWTNLPPLNALKAFAALAEAGSLTAAGAALNVSHAAVGQQVRLLEGHLGIALIRKSGRGVVLTPKGEELARSLSDAFGEIGQAVDALTGAEANRPLQLTMTPSFASQWLMPRLLDFRARHPDIEMMLNPSPALVPLEPGGMDVAIRFGVGDWPGVVAEMLVPTQFVIVASCSLADELAATDPETLLKLPWLQELGTNEIDDWLARQGIDKRHAASSTHMPGHLVLEGLRRGDGVAATARTFVEADLASGDLVLLGEDTQPDSGYYLVTRPGVQRPPVRAFVRWIRRQATI